MGLTISSLFNRLFGKRAMRILMGKTGPWFKGYFKIGILQLFFIRSFINQQTCAVVQHFFKKRSGGGGGLYPLCTVSRSIIIISIVYLQLCFSDSGFRIIICPLPVCKTQRGLQVSYPALSVCHFVSFGYSIMLATIHFILSM